MGVIPPNPFYGRSPRPNEKRARTAVLLIYIVTGVEILSLFSSVGQYLLLRAMERGAEVSEAAMAANDLRETIIGFVYTVAFIVSAVTFIRWFRRAYYNLHTRVPQLLYDEGWAAGAWFVPILNLFRPYQIMEELYTEGRALLLGNPSALAKTALGGWWALWILTNILSGVTVRISLRAETMAELRMTTLGNIVVSVLFVPLALVTVKVIRDYARIEPEQRAIPTKIDAAELPAG